MVPNFTQEPQLITVLIQDDDMVNRYPVGLGNISDQPILMQNANIVIKG